MKIAVVTCYKQNDYVRAVTLRRAFAATPDTEVIIVRNRHRGLLRYPEVWLKLLWLRIREKPDAYVLTFRAYELLLFMVLTGVRKPLIYDELINFTEWLQEHGKLKSGSLRYRLFRRWYAALVGHCRTILADTPNHSEYSARLNRLRLEQYSVVPVGVDEEIFKPRGKETQNESFTVFYYGSMLPLHGLEYVLEAASMLKKDALIDFRIVGGGNKAAQACASAAKSGANIKYESWLQVKKLAEAAAAADLCLGGPLGDTLQSQFVITGKTYQFLALGVPVLIGQNQATELFDDKQNCLMVPLADAQAIADAITWAKSHPSELKQIGQAGRELYEQHFSQKVINQKIRELVSRL